MFKEGDNVLVIDGFPHVKGVVEEVSTWREVSGTPNDNPCYKVRCELWKQKTRWFSAESIKRAPEL